MERESALQLLRDGRHQELWERCCGFFDLDIEQFMTIQKQLLLEQIELLSKCELGKKLLHGTEPRTVEEFREMVPLTTYSDYKPYLSEKMEDALPEKPIMWLRTSGRSEEYSCKWVPITKRMYQELGNLVLAVFIVGSCQSKGKITLEENDKILYGLAPPPYASGAWMKRLDEEGILKFLPPVAEAEGMGFQERVQAGFSLALLEGLDVMGAIASILIAIGDQFGKGGGTKKIGTVLKQPRQLPRLLRAILRSKLAGRPLLPRDIWTLKGILCSGTDAFIYREKLKDMWGKYPLDLYGATECQIIATQAWNYKNMTFIPYPNFLEFLPMADYTKWQQDQGYRPHTLLLDEVIPGERYAIVATNFMGGAYTRYVVGDIIEIATLRDEEANINTPQMAFFGRADGNIDLERWAHAYFTEKTVWQGIANSGVPYVDWVARKEVENGVPVLCLYIEPQGGNNLSEEKIRDLIHEEFKKLIQEYKESELFLGEKPLRIKLIPDGAFNRYMEYKRAAGADLAHIKPPHMNPSDSIMQALLGEQFTVAPSVQKATDEVNKL
jgi:hypothetical protein